MHCRGPTRGFDRGPLGKIRFRSSGTHALPAYIEGAFDRHPLLKTARMLAAACGISRRARRHDREAGRPFGATGHPDRDYRNVLRETVLTVTRGGRRAYAA